MNGSSARRSTPANARRTGKPSPSNPCGAVVTETTGRATLVVGSGVPTRGKVKTSSTVTAGMSHDLPVRKQSSKALPPCQTAPGQCLFPPHSPPAFRSHHLCDRDGRHECDLIIELAGGRSIAIEVKASSAPSLSDAKHLLWLREQLGDQFVCGLVMHTGPFAFPLTDRIAAVPIAALWGQAGRNPESDLDRT